MSSVSAACIFGAYSASSAHTDTFYIVPQIIRVRNSKRHFFSKLTFPYIIQPPRLHPTVTSTTTALLSPYGNIDHNCSASLYGNIEHNRPASPYGNIDHNRSASPNGHIDHNRLAYTLRQHRPQPPCLHPTATSTTAALLSPYGHIDHNHSASPYGNIDHSRSAFTLWQHRPQPLRLRPTATSTTAAPLSPYGNIDHSPSFRTTKPFEQLHRKKFVFF